MALSSTSAMPPSGSAIPSVLTTGEHLFNPNDNVVKVDLDGAESVTFLTV